MTVASRSESRDGTAVIWLAVHTTEGGGTARDLLNAPWWQGSSHAICDNAELLTPADGCVPYDRASWTLRNGNKRSENIEQIGYASWSREYWLANRMPQLRHTARWLRDRAAARGIPLDYIGIDGVRAGRAGVIQHNDYSKGTGDGTHWDCGPGYPIDVVMDMARGATIEGDDEMSAEAERQIAEIRSNMYENLSRTRSMHKGQYLPENGYGGDLTWFQRQAAVANAPILKALEQLGGGQPIDQEALNQAARDAYASQVEPLLRAHEEALAEQQAAFTDALDALDDDVAAAVLAKLHTATTPA